MQLFDVSSKEMIKSHSFGKGESNKIALWDFYSNDKLGYVTSSMACKEWKIDKTSKPKQLANDEKKRDDFDLGNPAPLHLYHSIPPRYHLLTQ